MIDGCGRNINYMRISVTDLCNLRCKYCTPHDVEKLSVEQLLTFEEIVGVCKAAIGLGITRFKFTGGEPLVRTGFVDLFRMISHIPGFEEGTLTTNGVLLEKLLPELYDCGLRSVNISLDTMDRHRYTQITGFDRLEVVLSAIRASVDLGMHVKVNAVLQHGVNDDDWESLVTLARDLPLEVRFIEMMPIGYGRDFLPVSNTDIMSRLTAKYGDFSECNNIKGNGPAKYIKMDSFKGAIGFISAINDKFCKKCNRIRLTSTGKIKPCLCFGDYVDLLPVLRNDDHNWHQELTELLKKAIAMKPTEHSFEEDGLVTEKHRMAEIGG